MQKNDLGERPETPVNDLIYAAFAMSSFTAKVLRILLYPAAYLLYTEGRIFKVFAIMMAVALPLIYIDISNIGHEFESILIALKNVKKLALSLCIYAIKLATLVIWLGYYYNVGSYEVDNYEILVVVSVLLLPNLFFISHHNITKLFILFITAAIAFSKLITMPHRLEETQKIIFLAPVVALILNEIWLTIGKSPAGRVER